MRLRIRHSTVYAYEFPIRSAVQLLRMTPRDHEGQYVGAWRVEIEGEGRLRAGEDSLGNVTHALYVDGPVSKIRVTVHGEVDVVETHGVVRGAIERFSPEVFLRETSLTDHNPDMLAFLAELDPQGADRLAFLHRLMAALFERIEFRAGATVTETTAGQAFLQQQGVCQDFAHMFVALARRAGVPARYVSGHLFRHEGAIEQEAAHAWAEAFVLDVGWIGFDVANGVCPTDCYVRVAVGLDYLGAAPVRGSRTGGGRENMEVALSVAGKVQ